MTLAQLFASTVVQQRGFYALFRNILDAGGINTLLEDHSNQTLIPQRITRAIWPSRKLELVNLIEKNRNVAFAPACNFLVNPDLNVISSDDTTTDQDEDQTLDCSTYPETVPNTSGQRNGTSVPLSQN